jgi:8-oxo-dGTP diphosphatase
MEVNIAMNKPQIGIGAVILNESHDHILLILRKKHPEANMRSVPGGKVEFLETLENATIREIKEEVGLDITVNQILCTAETINPENNEHWISIIYLTNVIAGEFHNCEPDKIADVKWFPINDIPENIACFTQPAIRLLNENNIMNKSGE